MTGIGGWWGGGGGSVVLDEVNVGYISVSGGN